MTKTRFAKGSGCYNCGCCGRKTRDTDGEGYLGLCAECYEIGGIENGISDGAYTAEHAAPRLAELRARIIAKGGTIA